MRRGFATPLCAGGKCPRFPHTSGERRGEPHDCSSTLTQTGAREVPKKFFQSGLWLLRARGLGADNLCKRTEVPTSTHLEGKRSADMPFVGEVRHAVVEEASGDDGCHGDSMHSTMAIALAYADERPMTAIMVVRGKTVRSTGPCPIHLP
jgi:hypothetical protein